MEQEPKAKMGRPSLYTPELAARICAELAAGYSLVQVVDAPDMPTRETVYQWLHIHKDFADNYARAREEQADHFADECVLIADMSVGMEASDVAAMRLRIDTRKWRAGTLKPKVYGNNAKLAIGGDEDNTEPIRFETTVSDVIREKLATIVNRSAP